MDVTKLVEFKNLNQIEDTLDYLYPCDIPMYYSDIMELVKEGKLSKEELYTLFIQGSVGVTLDQIPKRKRDRLIKTFENTVKKKNFKNIHSVNGDKKIVISLSLTRKGAILESTMSFS